MTKVKLNDVYKRYDDVTAVNGIDISIKSGEFLTVVGPSGCGKSTTLRLLCGLEPISEGEIRFDDEVVNEQEPKDRNVAMVFQDFALYPHMTARENIKFGMTSREKIGEKEIEERIKEAAGILEIEDLLDRKPSALSGGEKQRVGIGRAIVRDPDVFLLDEPLSNLDAKLRVQMRTEIADLHKELDATTIYVTHDQTEALTLGDRVAVLNSGELQQIEEPQKLYDSPTNKFVAEFIGSPSMNTIPVEIKHKNPDVICMHSKFELRIPKSSNIPMVDEAVLGIRPGDLTIINEESSSPTHISSSIIYTEPLGDSQLLHLQVGDSVIQVIHDNPHEQFKRGDSVSATFGRNQFHLFHPETGETIMSSSPEDAEKSLS